ncbi:O-antigen ligase family protein [bacterium]|nr:O-antigen ligase family protein [bacterium]
MLSVGIPLLFSSITRSVFEVNKLLLLRLVLIIVYGLWLSKSLLLRDNNITHDDKHSYVIFGLKWKRIGLEFSILLWILCNLISIFISENIFISLIGAYDRWEGLATILNYILLFYMTAKLIDNLRYRIVILSLCLFSTSISSIYGVFQSLGLDFMQWSASAIHRVFACINNPVHFCAYVAMLVPIGISLAQYALEKIKIQNHIDHSKKQSYIYFTTWTVLLFASALLTFSSFNSLLFLYLFFMLIVGVGIYNYTDLIPNRLSQLILGGFSIIFTLLVAFNFQPFNRFQLASLVFNIVILWCIRVLHNKPLLLYRCFMAATLVSFYAMLLSFSRATIIGFVVCFTYFLQLSLQKNAEIFKLSKLICLFFSTFVIHICLIFKLHLFGVTGIIIETIALIFSFVFLYYSSTIKTSVYLSLNCLYSFIFFALCCSTFIVTSPFLSYLAILIFLLKFREHINHLFIKNCLSLALVLQLLFYIPSITGVFGFFVYLIAYYCTAIRNQDSQHDRFHYLSILIGMGIIMLTPIISTIQNSYLNSIGSFLEFPQISHYALAVCCVIIVCGLVQARFHLKSILSVLIISVVFLIYIYNTPPKNPYLKSYKADTLVVANNIKSRMTSLSSNRARLYMWLSVPGWLWDYPLFGSGPDTIRSNYPLYRHPQYGLHEGGHNYTPDRLHNEYLNTLATKGIIGFILKYIFFIGGWYLIMLNLLIKHQKNVQKFFIIALIVSASIYLVQVLFNFGVVATLFLFYFLLGIGLSFMNDEHKDHVTSI